MRLWSLHPKYLDSKGFVALWREALLAKNVLEGKTTGYKNHPQLNRFKDSDNPVNCINQYLGYIYKESLKRDYNFDRKKIDSIPDYYVLTVNDKQIEYEFQHLLRKLKIRDKPGFVLLSSLRDIDPNPLFKVIKGEVEDWEIL